MTTIVEFHDSGCHVFHWESARGVHTLRASLRVPFAAPTPGPEEASPTPATPVPSAGTGSADVATHAANGAALRQALRDAGLRITEALAIVPKSWVTLRVVTLPSTDPAELTEMARFEAERHIPFNVERHIVAHRVMSVEGIEGARVLLAAMDGPVAEQVTATLSAAGIALTGIDVSTVALVNALRHSGLWMPQADPTVAAVHIGTDGSDIVVLHQGQIIFARSASLGARRLAAEEPAPTAASAEGGAKSPTEGETIVAPAFMGHEAVGVPAVPEHEAVSAPAVSEHEAVVAPPAVPERDATTPPALSAHATSGAERLAREVRRTLDYAHREFECPPLARVFVSGLECDTAKTILERSLETPIEILEPFVSPESLGGVAESSVRVRLAAKGPGLMEPEPAFAVGVGALLREVDDAALRVDLVPPAYDQARKRAHQRQTLMVVGAAVLVLLAAGFLTTYRVQSTRKEHLETLQAEFNKNRAAQNEIESRRSAVEILAKFTTLEGSALAVLNTISQWQDLFGPPGSRRLSITDFQYTARKKVSFMGYAADYADLNEFRARLTDSGIFSEVSEPEKQAMIDAPNNRAQKVLSFSLPCTLKGSEPAATKAKAPAKQQQQQQ